MTLRFNVLGFELARIDLDIERDEPSPANPQNLVVKGVKRMSWAWVKGMIA